MNNSIPKKHVFAGMSGGIDSSAAVKLLIDQGYKVTGVTFVGLGKQKSAESGKNSLLSRASRKCCSSEEIITAKNICYSLGIEHITLDLEEIFRKTVRETFVESYMKGETPNPCMLCNRHVKLGALIDFSLENGADYIAMGHYTGVEKINGEYLLKAGKDKDKDQSYFLALLKPEVLPKLLFPLGNKEKHEIRAIIDSADMPIQSSKLESQDICFIDDDYRDYLKEQGVKPYPGEFLLDDKPIGKHEGAAFYALGQRRGLNLSIGKRVFVREIDAENNKLHLGEKPFSKVFRVTDLNIFSKDFKKGEWMIQIRHRSPRTLGSIEYLDNNTIEVSLTEAKEIVSPGQYAVFYKNDYIYAAGKISSTDLI